MLALHTIEILNQYSRRYLSGAEDHYTQVVRDFTESSSGNKCAGVDLYSSEAPAFGSNGTYGACVFVLWSVVFRLLFLLLLLLLIIIII